MKAAFTYWNGRISPVFDVAAEILLVESSQGKVCKKSKLTLPTGSAMEKLEFLDEQGVDLLVCGAISRPVLCSAQAHDIQVHPFVSGEVSELIQACLEGRLEQGSFAMPGCGRGRQCRRGGGRSGNRTGEGRRRFWSPGDENRSK